MKVKYLLPLLVCFMCLSFSISNAQIAKVKTTYPASQDTIAIPSGAANAGQLEATINSDTANGTRINPNRVYKLEAGGFYIQNSAIIFNSASGTLTIVGEQGGIKPTVFMSPVNSVDPGANSITGSLKLDNLYWSGMITDGTVNFDIFTCYTANSKKQTLTVNNCLMEFVSGEWFNCDGWTSQATLKITNSYFRNLFYGGQWWAGRVFYDKQPIDTVWVENTTVTGGGLVFLTQGSLCKFTYYNHNTIINSNKYWQLGQNHLEGYWVNNMFLNENWVGEDKENIAKSGQDQDGLLMGCMSEDTLYVTNGSLKDHILVPSEYLNSDSTINQKLLGIDKMKAFISDNIHWTDTTLLDVYYKNTGGYNSDFTDCPASYLNWYGYATAGPWKVVNVPGIWMNERTQAFFDGSHPYMVQQNNIFTEVKTVTPGIKDATVADLMAKWDSYLYGSSKYDNTTVTALDNSSYIFGDFSPATFPGYDANGAKTEDGSGISKFTDLQENFLQSGTVHKSTLDGLPIGSLIWDDNLIASYNSESEWQTVQAAYSKLTGVKTTNNLIPQTYQLEQNYPNPFNPSTTINFAVPKSGNVSLIIYNVLGQKVRTLFNSGVKAGNFNATWDGKDNKGMSVASGIYFYRLSAGSDFVATKKMMLLK
jgi:hypothetical protein